jgi:DNA-binding CsgD family transcriptional regulator
LIADSGGYSAVRARALLGAAFLAHYQGDDSEALALMDQGMAIARGIPDRRESIPRRRVYLLALLARGLLAEDQGTYAAAMPPLEEAFDLAFRSGDRTWIAVTLLHLGIVTYGNGDLAAAEERLQEALTHFRALPDLWGAASALDFLGLVAAEQLSQQRAATFYIQSLTLFREIGSREGLASGLANAASLVATAENPEEAVRLFGTANALADQIGSLPKYPEQVVHQRGLDAARSALDASVFRTAFADGRTQPVERAFEDTIAILKQIAKTPARSAAPREYPAGLSEREVEVLQLVARGLTNGEVGDRLFLSENTIRAHLRRIYQKLDVSTRAEAVRFAVEHHLG